MDPLPYLRLAEIEIDPQHLAEYRPVLAAAMQAAIMLEPGVLMLHAVADADRPGRITVFEAYADRAAYDSHLTTPHFLSYKERTAGMVRSLTLKDASAIALMAKGGMRASHELG